MNTDKLKDFLSMPSTQRRGLFVMSILIVILIISPIVYKTFFFNPVSYDLKEYKKEIEGFQTKISFSDTQNNKYDPAINFDHMEQSAASNRMKPFNFNPNQLPAQQWLKMGFSERQVQSIKNYESKGGRFYTKQDVKKLYAISVEEYQIIEPYILLPDSMSYGNRSAANNKPEKTIPIVELNAADTTLLKMLPGIGSVYASKIYRYKIQLGGFHSMHQLLEIQGFDSLRLEQIKPYIDINPWLVRKINVNTASFEQLNAHPYISHNVAISLINYRNRHGKFVVLEDIMKSELIDKNLYSILAPYLTTQ